MNSIKKIQDFTSDIKSNYGLDGIGYFYEILDPFDIEILVGYDKESSKGETKIKWGKIKTKIGDLISVGKNKTYFHPEDFEGFVECRPVKKEYSTLWNKLADDSKIKKMGKTPTGNRPLLMSERDELSLNRSLL